VARSDHLPIRLRGATEVGALMWHKQRQVAIQNGLRKRGVRKIVAKATSKPGKGDRAAIRNAFKPFTPLVLRKWSKVGVLGLSRFE
jgi:hypothetical protein